MYESYYVLSMGDTTYARTTATLDLLTSCPSLGRVCGPEYEVTPPLVECRRIVVPNTTDELFYYVDEAHRKIKVIHACDARSDPRSKFVVVHAADL